MSIADTAPTVAAPAREPAIAVQRRPRRRWRRYRAALVPGLVLAAVCAAALLAPVVAPYDPDAINPAIALADPAADHLLGTDQLGRDELSRLLYGGRATLVLSAVSTLGVLALGLLVGLVAGYFGGRLDLALSTVLTVLLALPSLLLTLAILGILGPGTGSLLVALVGAGWVGHARVFRASVLGLREQLYVDAAVASGASAGRILVRHLLPNLLPTVVILGTLDLGALMLTVSSLSFLGLGIQPPTADWGVMLNDGRSFFGQAPLLVFAPGIGITLVVLLSNLLGDALRDLVDTAQR